ncbi:MAG: GDSL-type esterase/lipase family protein [Chthoniobacterales bacterium]
MKTTPFRAVAFLLVVLAPRLFAESALKANDRVVFIGDSITAQGAKAAKGWAPLIRETLGKTGKKCDFISLGGGGQTLESWQNVELKSRTEPLILDVPNVDVKETLDRGAEVIVVMLGMNNVLSPRLTEKPEALDKWAENYRNFIRDLRARAHPRVFAIATPTLCTENENSTKNRVMRLLIERIQAIAKSENCLVLPTHEAMNRMLNEGRRRDPEFSVTVDLVHPNQAGHVSIAAGMLEGLGESKAAQLLLAEWIPKFWNDKQETLSWWVEEQAASGSGETATFRISYEHQIPGGSSAGASLEPPDGWKIVTAEKSAATGFFVVEGTPDRLTNRFALKAGSLSRTVSIPAPWIVGVGNAGGNGWKGIEFNPKGGALPVDDAFSRGEGFGALQEVIPGHPILWKRYFAATGYAGGPAEGALDISAVSFFQTNDVCYGARWIYSDRQRSVSLRVVSLGISGKNHLTAWMNGHEISSGMIAVAPVMVKTELEKGWNRLVFKSNHRQWRWQFALDIVPQQGDVLEDLRIRIHPPE